MLDTQISFDEVLAYLNYKGQITESTKIKNSFWNLRQSVELTQGCNSESFLFYQYLQQGFLVNCSPFFRGSYFRVRYFNYEPGKYWP